MLLAAAAAAGWLLAAVLLLAGCWLLLLLAGPFSGGSAVPVHTTGLGQASNTRKHRQVGPLELANVLY